MARGTEMRVSDLESGGWWEGGVRAPCKASRTLKNTTCLKCTHTHTGQDWDGGAMHSRLPSMVTSSR